MFSLRSACLGCALVLFHGALAAAQSPPNDDCASAVLLTVGAPPITGATFNSTDSLVSHPCTGATGDVWYAFDAAGSGTFLATATSSSGEPISVVAYDN